jgi:hypothetical protein
VFARCLELWVVGGGWGTTLIYGHDFIDDPAPWKLCMELLAREVAPRLTAVGLLPATMKE